METVPTPGAVRVALTREVSASFPRCELTHLPRVPIEVDLARRQHAAYEDALAAAGYRVERLPADDDLADSVFIEDIAMVFDELAVVTRPGAASRRRERPAVAAALEAYRPLKAIEAPGTLDGGDVLRMGRRVYVGASSRTSVDAMLQLQQILAPYGYTVCQVAVAGCLHLKSAVTVIGEEVLLVNPDRVPAAAFGAAECIAVDPAEPMAANALHLWDRIIFPAAFPRTADRLARRGFTLVTVDASELAKAEGAVTCCSIVFDAHMQKDGRHGR